MEVWAELSLWARTQRRSGKSGIYVRVTSYKESVLFITECVNVCLKWARIIQKTLRNQHDVLDHGQSRTTTADFGDFNLHFYHICV